MVWRKKRDQEQLIFFFLLIAHIVSFHLHLLFLAYYFPCLYNGRDSAENGGATSAFKVVPGGGGEITQDRKRKGEKPMQEEQSFRPFSTHQNLLEREKKKKKKDTSLASFSPIFSDSYRINSRALPPPLAQLSLLFVLLFFLGLAVLLGGGHAARRDQHAAIGAVLQRVLAGRIGPALLVPELREHLLVQALHLLLHLPDGADELHLLLQQAGLVAPQLLHPLLQLDDGVQLALAAVLGRQLVLAPPADVADEGQLRLAQVVLGQQLVELLHRQVDDLLVGEGDLHGAGAALVPAGVLVQELGVGLELGVLLVSDRLLPGRNGEVWVLGEGGGERQVVRVVVADALQLGEAVELGGVLVAHPAELAVPGLVAPDGPFLGLRRRYLRVGAVAHRPLLGEGGGCGRGGRGGGAGGLGAAGGGRAAAGVQREAGIRIELVLQLRGLSLAEALLHGQVQQADLVQHGLLQQGAEGVGQDGRGGQVGAGAVHVRREEEPRQVGGPEGGVDVAGVAGGNPGHQGSGGGGDGTQLRAEHLGEVLAAAGEGGLVEADVLVHGCCSGGEFKVCSRA